MIGWNSLDITCKNGLASQAPDHCKPLMTMAVFEMQTNYPYSSLRAASLVTPQTVLAKKAESLHAGYHLDELRPRLHEYVSSKTTSFSMKTQRLYCIYTSFRIVFISFSAVYTKTMKTTENGKNQWKSIVCVSK